MYGAGNYVVFECISQFQWQNDMTLCIGNGHRCTRHVQVHLDSRRSFDTDRLPSMVLESVKGLHIDEDLSVRSRHLVEPIVNSLLIQLEELLMSKVYESRHAHTPWLHSAFVIVLHARSFVQLKPAPMSNKK